LLEVFDAGFEQGGMAGKHLGLLAESGDLCILLLPVIGPAVCRTSPHAASASTIVMTRIG
jgi:hypothetical protein